MLEYLTYFEVALDEDFPDYEERIKAFVDTRGTFEDISFSVGMLG